MNILKLEYDTQPSSIVTLLQAFLTRKSRYRENKDIPQIILHERSLASREKHYHVFREICGLKDREFLSLMYPYTRVYPGIMRLLAQKEIPFSLFSVLNTYTEVLLLRPFSNNELQRLSCYNSDLRIVRKGIEFDVTSEIYSLDGMVWKSVTTYFSRYKHHRIVDGKKPIKLDALSDSSKTINWFLKGNNRFRFALVSGDTNGIHYFPLYAKSFGFEGDFAQPIRIVARCIEEIPGIDPSLPMKLFYHLKGPVYYNRNLEVKYQNGKETCRFDLYCEGNDRPCICGEVKLLSQ